MSDLIARMIEALRVCPCCKAERRTSNTPLDGIPDGMVHESVFGCGSAAFLSSKGIYEVSRSCPWPMEDELAELQDNFGEAR